MRRYFNGVKSIPVNDSVITTAETAPAFAGASAEVSGGADIPIRIYRKAGTQEQKQPVLFYIHGGGFAAGCCDVVEEMCRELCAGTGFPVVQIEYRLAPEHPFPCALDDCYAVLQWIYAHAESFGGSRERICIAGDSAGGNLAAVCAMKDRDSGKKIVKAMALLYPTVNLTGKKDSYYHGPQGIDWILKEHRKAAKFRMEMTSGSSRGALGCLLKTSDPSIPEVSPYNASMKDLPPALIIYGEMDHLRAENDAYARKLKEAGVSVTVIRYLGMSHAFAEFTGVQPQADDCMAEIGKFMAALR
jgi:acetyl esterase/lipase